MGLPSSWHLRDGHEAREFAAPSYCGDVMSRSRLATLESTPNSPLSSPPSAQPIIVRSNQLWFEHDLRGLRKQKLKSGC